MQKRTGSCIDNHQIDKLQLVEPTDIVKKYYPGGPEQSSPASLDGASTSNQPLKNRMSSSLQSSASKLQYGSQSMERLPKISEVPKDTLKKSLVLIEHFKKIKYQKKEIKKL